MDRWIMNRWVGLITTVVGLVAMMACGLRNNDPTPVALAAADLAIYDDALAAGWQNWSWDTTVDPANSMPVASGTASLALTYHQPWAGLSLRAPSPLASASYGAIAFDLHGGDTGIAQLHLYLQATDTGTAGVAVTLDAPASAWRTVIVTLSDLGSPATIARINLQEQSGQAQPTFYVDNIRLIGRAGAPTATPTTAPSDRGTITIDGSGEAKTVDPRLLGTNLPTWLGPERLANPTFQARTAASGVSVIRMPGGSWSNHYGWLSCELRADQPNALPCGDGWGSWAARPTDFIDFLQATGTQGMWVVSINSTPEEAAAAVAFFNSTPDDPTSIGVDRNGFDWQSAGHWAQLRVDKGNPQPANIQLWAVGNEVYGGTPTSGGTECAAWGWEDVWSCDGTAYVNGDGTHEGYAAFRAAMHAVDPTILVGAVGVTPSSDYANWGNEVVAAAGATMDFYDIHQYGFFAPPATDAALLASPQSAWTTIMTNVRSTFSSKANGRAIPVGVTEYNLFSVQDQDNAQLLTRAVNALYLADTIGRMAEEGIVMANQWDLANGRAGNGTEYGLMHEDNNFYRSPQYYVFPLWARFGTALLPTTTSFDAASTVSVYGGRVDDSTYTLLAINKTAQTQQATIMIRQGATALSIQSGLVDQLQATALSAQSVYYNGTADPAHDLSDAPARSLTVTTPANQLHYDFVPYSVTLLRLQVTENAPIATLTVTATTSPTTVTPTSTPINAATATPTLLPTDAPTGQAIYLPVVTR